MDAVLPKDLNNFFFNLPGGFYRELSKELGILEKTFEEHMANDDCTRNPDCMSEKKKKQRIIDFFKEVDSTIIYCGHELEIVESRVKEASSTKERDRILQLLYVDLLEVYLELLRQGYTHEDLTT